MLWSAERWDENWDMVFPSYEAIYQLTEQYLDPNMKFYSDGERQGELGGGGGEKRKGALNRVFHGTHITKHDYAEAAGYQLTAHVQRQHLLLGH